jgi:hypothetical protein
MTATKEECEKMWQGKNCKINPIGSWMIAPLAGYKNQDECEKDTNKICSIDPRDTYKRWLTTDIQKPASIGTIPKGDPNALPIAQRIPPTPTPTSAPIPIPIPEPITAPVVATVTNNELPWVKIIIGILIVAFVIGTGAYYFTKNNKKKL